MTTICISSGHSTRCQGAADILNEVEEATNVVDEVALYLRDAGVEVEKFHDTVSVTQNENLNRIVDWHNSHVRDLDVSVHFNAFERTTKPMGTEVLYVTQKNLAAGLSEAIAVAAGLPDRGAKYRDDLFFLNHTAAPAVLIEVCFVDSSADAEAYHSYFPLICEAIADVLVAGASDVTPPEPDYALFHAIGSCSYFGGPDDEGVAPDEGLAFIDAVDDAPQLFLPHQPEDTSGLARRLNPYVHYLACRWDYNITPKATLLEHRALVRAIKTGIALKAFPADWGPNENTGRVADLSPGLIEDLGIETDDDVEVIYPYREDMA